MVDMHIRHNGKIIRRLLDSRGDGPSFEAYARRPGDMSAAGSSFCRGRSGGSRPCGRGPPRPLGIEPDDHPAGVVGHFIPGIAAAEVEVAVAAGNSSAPRSPISNSAMSW